ncbi:MAG TPA: hypothetical protein VLA72_11835 [Anaerolineales bacterium]|nr:hypothetical protein [Anaerolineales bacterium]
MPVKAKSKTKAKVLKRKKTEGRGKAKTTVKASAKTKTGVKKKKQAVEKAHVVNQIAAPRIEKPKKSRTVKSTPKYTFMKEPGDLHDFKVGKKIEVYCDHDKSKERIRGWIDGTIVQIDNKMVAVQFRSNVYLTDGWMVPDRILWYPLNSEHVRPVGSRKTVKKRRAIPDY